MPMIKVELLEGRSLEQKRAFVELVTREGARILKCQPRDIDIIFVDVGAKNWAVGGTLVGDSQS